MTGINQYTIPGGNSFTLFPLPYGEWFRVKGESLVGIGAKPRQKYLVSLHFSFLTVLVLTIGSFARTRVYFLNNFLNNLLGVWKALILLVCKIFRSVFFSY